MILSKRRRLRHRPDQVQSAPKNCLQHFNEKTRRHFLIILFAFMFITLHHLTWPPAFAINFSSHPKMPGARKILVFLMGIERIRNDTEHTCSLNFACRMRDKIPHTFKGPFLFFPNKGKAVTPCATSIQCIAWTSHAAPA